MADLYSHRQFGRAVFLIAIGVAALVAVIVPLVISASGGRDRGTLVMMTAVVPGLLACGLLMLFSSLNVRVTGERLEWAFGPGFPNYSTRVSDITHVEKARTPLIFGIGIRMTPQGWLYNVSSGSAVAVTTGRKTVLIGTDDPEGLIRAIEKARGRAAGAT